MTGRRPRPTPAWSGFRRVEAEFLRPHRAAIALAALGLLAQSLLALPAPLLQGWVVDRLAPLFAGGTFRPPADGGRLGRMIALALAATVAVHLARMVLGWKVAATLSRVALEAVRELTDALHRKLQRRPMGYFDRHQSGQIMARVTGDVGSLLVFLGGGAVQALADLVLAAGIAALMAWLNWPLALACFAAVPLFALNHKVFAGAIHRLSREIRGQIAAVYALLSERVSAVRVVRSFAREDAELAELDRRLDAHRTLAWSSQKAVAGQGAVASFVGGLGSVAVVAVGSALVGRGRMTVGEMLAFYALVAQFYGPILRLAGLQPMIAGTLAAVDRIVEVLDESEPVPARPASRPRRVRGSLVYRGVTFAYAPGGRRVLDDIDLEIEPGMTVGLLGASGSGKSTVLSLAPRIYDLDEAGGAILLDGRDVRGLDPAGLRRAVALVPQRAMLFRGTIRSNLTYARPDAHERL
ncbi:MAG TPA: ABC transporter ATP-binding protein, partial [Isosphaeraceae bacterium]